MKQVINFLLPENKETEKVNQIRKKYDPAYEEIWPHLTLVYPFQKINEEEIHNRIKKIIRNFKPFNVSFKNLEKSAKGNYLYLLPKKGKKKILKLHKKLHTGPLENHSNPDMPEYIPHITVGVFDTEQELDEAINSLKRKKPKFEFFLDRLHLLEINEKGSINKGEEFFLGEKNE